MDLTQLIQHPELMDKETLYDLRNLVALYPYYQTARLLMLKNLYLLHDSSFDEELRRAAVYMTRRENLFDMVEAAHYGLPQAQRTHQTPGQKGNDTPADGHADRGNRTLSLIDTFLDQIPVQPKPERKKRKPTPADAAVDYVAYLMDCEGEEDKQPVATAPQMKGQTLIDNFINQEGGKITLKETPEFVPQIDNASDGASGTDDSFFTETLAQIYIKQGRYSKALEIIQRLNLNYPKKNAYFADQIRFLEKLILNNKINNKKQ